MSNTFLDLLETGKTLVADGAMGTALFARGLESGGSPELLNVDRPELIGAVHSDYITAGADIVLTNTFGGNRLRLALHGAGGRVAELNAAAVAIARDAAAKVDRPVVVAGSIGPTGELFEPLGSLDPLAARHAFHEQASALTEAGADVLWIETLSSYEELVAAAEGCADLGLPVVATMSFDTQGKTMMGVNPAELAEWAQELGLTAVGANCGVSPGDNLLAVHTLARTNPAATVVVKGNCGIPLYAAGDLIYPTGPEHMPDYVELAMASGARIVGACCGSTPAHIAAIRTAVDHPIERGPVEAAEIATRFDVTAGPPRRAKRKNARRS